MKFFQQRGLLHIVLFAATFGTATLSQGPYYAVAVMTILLAHELGHYFMCRKYQVAATFPIFIPMPNILGTLGAVIAMKSPVPNRKALFDIGIAGPLAGLFFAIPAIVIGLYMSTIQSIPQEGVKLFLGEPLLFSWLSKLILGPIQQGQDIVLHPIAFAGWAALFVTSINLFPVGQLDGGHIMYALAGIYTKYISWIVVLILAVLGYVFDPLWYVFLVLILIFIISHPKPLEDQVPVSRNRYWLGILALIIFILCFTPTPFDFRVI